MAMKQDINALRGLRNKHRMVAIPISGPLYIYDNISVVYNTSRLELVLKKGNNSVCYHIVYESVDLGKSLVGHITSCDNIADLMTKVTCCQKKICLISNILHDIYGDH